MNSVERVIASRREPLSDTPMQNVLVNVSDIWLTSRELVSAIFGIYSIPFDILYETAEANRYLIYYYWHRCE